MPEYWELLNCLHLVITIHVSVCTPKWRSVAIFTIPRCTFELIAGTRRSSSSRVGTEYLSRVITLLIIYSMCNSCGREETALRDLPQDGVSKQYCCNLSLVSNVNGLQTPELLRRIIRFYPNARQKLSPTAVSDTQNTSIDVLHVPHVVWDDFDTILTTPVPSSSHFELLPIPGHYTSLRLRSQQVLASRILRQHFYDDLISSLCHNILQSQHRHSLSLPQKAPSPGRKAPPP